MTVGDASVREGNGGTTTATVVISLSEATDVDVIVRVDITGGTATAGTDYRDWAGGYVDVVIAAGDTTATVSIILVTDKLREGDETIVVTVAAVTSESGATGVAGDTGTVTIVDDDNK